MPLPQSHAHLHWNIPSSCRQICRWVRSPRANRINIKWNLLPTPCKNESQDTFQGLRQTSASFTAVPFFLPQYFILVSLPPQVSVAVCFNLDITRHCFAVLTFSPWRAASAHSRLQLQFRSLDLLIPVSISKAKKPHTSGAAAMTTACVSAAVLFVRQRIRKAGGKNALCCP